MNHVIVALTFSGPKNIQIMKPKVLLRGKVVGNDS